MEYKSAGPHNRLPLQLDNKRGLKPLFLPSASGLSQQWTRSSILVSLDHCLNHWGLFQESKGAKQREDIQVSSTKGINTVLSQTTFRISRENGLGRVNLFLPLIFANPIQFAQISVVDWERKKNNYFAEWWKEIIKGVTLIKIYRKGTSTDLSKNLCSVSRWESRPSVGLCPFKATVQTL